MRNLFIVIILLILSVSLYLNWIHIKSDQSLIMLVYSLSLFEECAVWRSDWPRLIKTQLPTNKVPYLRKKFAYCYHSVNIISFSVFKCDHIKLLLLYLSINLFTKNFFFLFQNWNFSWNLETKQSVGREWRKRCSKARMVTI